MMIRLGKFILVFLLLFSSACSGLLPDPAEPTPGMSTEDVSSLETLVAETLPASTPTPGPPLLRVWIPPEFDPQAGTPAGVLFQNALDEFVSLHPGLRIEVRVKALEGAGGLLESLSAASTAAPEIIPDLVALPRSSLEAAALKGLLHPYDGLTSTMDSGDWYPYALQLARIQNTTYGIPFAADIQMLVYRSEVIETPPQSISEVLASELPLSLPAFDPQSMFALSLYLSRGGAVQDDQGRPALDAAVLTEVLQVYQSLDLRGWSQSEQLDPDTNEEVLREFKEGRTPQAVLWGSTYFQSSGELPADTAIAQVPALNAEGFSLAVGWVWGLSSVRPENQALAVSLAETLTAPEFLGSWTFAAGLFPPRSGALSGWEASTQWAELQPISEHARLAPSSGVLTSIIPIINQAVLQVLSGTKSPEVAADEAAAKVR